MHTRHLPLFLTLVLAACSSAPTPLPEVETASSSSVSVQAESSSASSVAPVAFEQALDATFTSQALGIEVRYPSSTIVGDCPDSIPVIAREGDGVVEFVLDHMPDETCAYVESDVYNKIYAQRATSKEEVAAFITEVFSPDCTIIEMSDYTENGDEYSMVFSCDEAVRWNKTTGAVVFSALGSKTGGAPDWPASTQILMPDGSIEYSFDYPIMQSIRYLKSE